MDSSSRPWKQGKTKDLFLTEDPQVLRLCFRDAASAYGGLIRGEVPGKGSVNNRVSDHLMRYLEAEGIPTQYLKELDERNTLVRRLDMLPLEVIVRNLAAGSLTERLGLKEGTRLGRVVLEFNYKSDELDDPLVNEYHITTMGWATAEELDIIDDVAMRVNGLLTALFDRVDIELVDFKLEFGRRPDGTLALGNEISPDSCRLWDKRTGEKLDKDVFTLSRDMARDAYLEVARRLLGD